VGNASLRTYQLLISPSIVSYKIREQFYSFHLRTKSFERFFPKKWNDALYILCLKEWNLDSIMYFYTWSPVKWVGKKMGFVNLKWSLIFAPILIVMIIAAHWLDGQYHMHLLPEIFGMTALLFVIKSFSEKESSINAFLLVVFNHAFIASAVFFNELLSWTEVVIYMSGVVIFGAFGLCLLAYLNKRKEDISLRRFHGHAYEYPIIAVLFLIACLGLTGFPISPTFLGEDLIFSHIREDQFFLAFFVAFSYVIGGISLMRQYAKLFLGPHSKTYHEIAYRNS
jgi:hypothetical protein